MTPYGFDIHCDDLGEDQVDVIIQNVLSMARSLWPEKTAEAEAWVTQRLFNYGIDYSKYKAEMAYQTATQWLSSPAVLLGLGLFAGYLAFRK